MTTHLISDPTASASAVFPAAPGWETLSAALTAEVPVIADRDDLLVTIAPGAGHGAPACFLPTLATIEVDGTHLGAIDPATAKPHLISDRTRYATAWGLLTHECAHSQHTRWKPTTGNGTDPAALAAAVLLEEPRIEAAHIRRRPDDRHWLRASATNLILNDTNAADPKLGPQMTAHDAAHTAALLLARTDGGILTRTETAPVARVVEDVLGKEKLGQLRAVWREAFTVADDDTDAMLELGRRWCEIVGPPPQQPDPATGGTGTPDPSGTPSTTPGTGDPSNPSGTPSPLAESITQALGKVARSVARVKLPTDPTEAAANAKAAAEAKTKATNKAAAKVFNTGGPRDGRTETTGTRPPTDTERTAARVLAHALSTAGTRDRVATKTTSALPPGRLRMRGALAREAQLTAGRIPTAEPFTRTTRTTVPTPPLRLGIACDVSGSMRSVAAPVASTAWILAHAAHHTPIPADTATVIFGHHVRPITRPGTAPATVTEFASRDNWEAVDEAIDALDGALGLSQPGAARLLVFVSDGDFRDGPRRRGQHKLDQLIATGCGVLWLTPTLKRGTPLDGATVHELADPATTAQTIGRAATAALRATAPR